jgi:hypothetical protein
LKSGDRLRFDREEFQFSVEKPDSTVTSARSRDLKTPPSWPGDNPTVSDGTEHFTPDELAEYLRKAKERQALRPQAELRDPCLVIASGNQESRTVLLKVTPEAMQEWTIGRNPRCEIRFDERDVSEWHAKIVREGARWKLVDAISSNGTFVNDLQIGMCFLAAADNLRFGRVQCVFQMPTKAPRILVGVPARFNRTWVAGVAGGLVLLLLAVALLWWLRGPT